MQINSDSFQRLNFRNDFITLFGVFSFILPITLRFRAKITIYKNDFTYHQIFTAISVKEHTACHHLHLYIYLETQAPAIVMARWWSNCFLFKPTVSCEIWQSTLIHAIVVVLLVTPLRFLRFLNLAIEMVCRKIKTHQFEFHKHLYDSSYLYYIFMLERKFFSSVPCHQCSCYYSPPLLSSSHSSV